MITNVNQLCHYRIKYDDDIWYVYWENTNSGIIIEFTNKDNSKIKIVYEEIYHTFSLETKLRIKTNYQQYYTTAEYFIHKYDIPYDIREHRRLGYTFGENNSILCEYLLDKIGNGRL